MRQIDHDASALREAEIRCTHSIMLLYGILLQAVTEAGETALPMVFVNLCKDMLQLREMDIGDDNSEEMSKTGRSEVGC